MRHFHYVDLGLVEVSLGLVELWSGLEEGLGWFQDRLESHVDFAVPEISICTPPPVVSSARWGFCPPPRREFLATPLVG